MSNQMESNGEIMINFYCHQCGYHYGYIGMDLNNLKETFKYEF